jgi:hypothetical protein
VLNVSFVAVAANLGMGEKAAAINDDQASRPVLFSACISISGALVLLGDGCLPTSRQD